MIASLKRIGALIVKELHQVVRDPGNVGIAVILPAVLLLLFGYGMSMDIKNVRIAYLAVPASGQSTSLETRLTLSKYFQTRRVFSSHEAEELLRTHEVDAFIALQSNAPDTLNGGITKIQIVVNGVNANQATLIRSYRESPHTDVEQTIRFVCSHLLELLEHRRSITPVYRKLPLILGGEQSVSADEPVRSINQYMDEMEKDDRILSASWHVGYIRHDTDVAGCGVVVIPSSNEFRPYAEQKADELAAYVWDRRHEFHYTGLTQEPDEALQTALHCTGKPAFLTDSGDNTTSGAMGANTWVLRQVLAKPEALQGKRVLFAAIQDPAVYTLLAGHTVGDTLPLTLGMGLDSLTEPVQLTVTLKHLGRQEGTVLFAEHGDFGGCATVSVEGLPIDVIVTDTNHPFVERHQTLAAGVDWMDYDVVIVKTGYAFPEPTQQGALCVMSLTDGATLQDTRRLPFKRIMRPMFPVDDI